VVCSGATAVEQLAGVRLVAARHGYAVALVPLATLGADSAWPKTCDRLRTVAALAPAIVVVYDELEAFPREPAALAQLSRQVRDLAGNVPLYWAVPEDAPWQSAV